jgi:hypothetical protein
MVALVPPVEDPSCVPAQGFASGSGVVLLPQADHVSTAMTELVCNKWKDRITSRTLTQAMNLDLTLCYPLAPTHAWQMRLTAQRKDINKPDEFDKSGEFEPRTGQSAAAD